MKLHLRFGMHRDIQLMHEMKAKFDGFVIPAHILAHQAASTSVFVTSLFDRPYVIDPMTFILQNKKIAHVSEAGTIRPSVDKLFSAYHPDLIARVTALGDDDVLQPKQYPDLDQVCANCLVFQTDKVAQSAGETGASKYLKRYSKTQATRPRLVVPPYFVFQSPADHFYAMTVRCARLFQALSKDIPVAPVILCPPKALAGAGLGAVIEDFKQFPVVFLWMDGFAQGQAKAEDIVRVRKLVRGLSASGVQVEALYGGYLMAAMWFDGMRAISHGILYTQHKVHTLSPGSGGAPERYYIPGIWDFRSLSQTEIILRMHPDLMCGCEVCNKVLAGNPDNFVRFFDQPDLLRKHFLTVRRQELDGIEGSSAAAEAERFRMAFAKYHKSFAALPNPDAMIEDAKMQGLEYLLNWADGVTTAI